MQADGLRCDLRRAAWGQPPSVARSAFSVSCVRFHLHRRRCAGHVVSTAPLILAFLGRYFVERNHGPTSIPALVVALDDELYALNAADPSAARYPKAAVGYLED
jgi:hypothetical protein